MDMMELRRMMMVQGNTSINTSPIITEENKKWTCSSSTYYTTNNTGTCTTIFYSYTPSASKQTIVSYRANGNSVLLRDDTYIDYWPLSSSNSEQSRNVINANTNKISFTLNMNNLDDCYAYMQESGEIIFAGRNSIYYGHRNISEIA